ncbi:hypothetical protein [Legionella feeleii]|uniref:hypothetical protein n=1 Tax=Legionella feeleii TaxID=453 RepID=UPI0011C06BE7|nr:hypothetical protein [Legionella feeleii]
MSDQHKERYDFEITEEGLDYDILDLSFNPTTQAFIERNGIKPGMRVLDVGSGSGLMDSLPFSTGRPTGPGLIC